MKVRAVRLGYYNEKRQNPGAIFYLKEAKHFSENWMKELSKEVKPKAKAGSKAKAKVAVSPNQMDSKSEVI